MKNQYLLQNVLSLLCFGHLHLTTSAQAAENPVKIENEFARVLVVDSKPGAKSQLHEHKMNRVMIYLDAGRMIFTDEKGKVEKLNFKTDEALWSPATTSPHISENVSDHPVRIVEVELKASPKETETGKPTDLDWVKVDPKRYQVEFENSQIRVVRVRYGPHEKGAFHEHPYPLLVVYLSPGQMKVTPPNHETVTVNYERGDVKFGGPSKHVEENLSDKSLEVVVVEFKPQQ